jgi:ribosomal protein L11
MTEETQDNTAPAQPELSQVQITLEQICAAIIAQNDNQLSVPTAVLLQDYSQYTIEITHDDEANLIYFSLKPLAEVEENQEAEKIETE